jgi:hypothetical protein
VPTTASPSGVAFLLEGVVVESRHPSAHHSRVNTQIRLAGLDDGGVFGCRDLVGGVIFWSLGSHLLSMLAPLVWVEVFGYRRCASAAGLLLAACLSPRSLKGLAVPFGSDFLSRDVDRAVVVLAVAVVLVSFDGAPYLVELGRVAKCGFRRFSLKLCRVGFSLSGLPYKPDTGVEFVSVFGRFPL